MRARQVQKSVCSRLRLKRFVFYRFIRDLYHIWIVYTLFVARQATRHRPVTQDGHGGSAREAEHPRSSLERGVGCRDLTSRVRRSRYLW